MIKIVFQDGKFSSNNSEHSYKKSDEEPESSNASRPRTGSIDFSAASKQVKEDPKSPMMDM